MSAFMASLLLASAVEGFMLNFVSWVALRGQNSSLLWPFCHWVFAGLAAEPCGIFATVNAPEMGPADLKKLGCEKLWWSTYAFCLVICTRYPFKLSGYQSSVVHLRAWHKTVVMQTK
jgi:hypothetical protein